MKKEFDVTKYIIDLTVDVQKKLDDCQNLINDVHDLKTYAQAASEIRFTNGLICSAYHMVNNVEDCSSNDVLQDMLEVFEERSNRMQDVLAAMKKQYWDKNGNV